MSKDTKKYYQLGQYFTTNNYLDESVYKQLK